MRGSNRKYRIKGWEGEDRGMGVQERQDEGREEGNGGNFMERERVE